MASSDPTAPHDDRSLPLVGAAHDNVPMAGERTGAGEGHSRASDDRWVAAIESYESEQRDSLHGLTRKGIATRQRIIDASWKVFERDGFTGARLGDIVEEADVSIGTFYKYFTHKEDLFVIVAFEAIRNLYPERGFTAGLDPIRGIERSNRRYLEVYRSQVGILRAVEEVTALSPAFRAARHVVQSQFPRRNARALEVLQEAGLIDPTLDPRDTSLALGAMVRQYAYFWLLEGEESDFDRSVFVLTQLWCKAIGLDVGMPDVWEGWLAEHRAGGDEPVPTAGAAEP